MAGGQRKMKDERKDIDVLLKEEGKMLERGARMLACGENGQSCSLNPINTPEIDIQNGSRNDMKLHRALKPLYGSDKIGRYRL